jgi:hypothetical protein
VKLIQLLRELVTISGVQKRPANVAAEQIVPRIKFICHSVNLERRQASQDVSVFRRQVRFAKVLVYLLKQKQSDLLERDLKRDALG